ncbi:EndoU domain-containing protein [Chromobacterium vaccinii]|uniref:EndoU domain-containing protein n=1 Tax=Chromobacterium vaccinii TaxID=1108595 RepID=A0ABV0FFE1_9NEIS|nr:EndoU domain-containing protein [Chromobacterium vaccinii]MCD4483037.1 EndoU domain-containing protein [Chromobacterium vaccinii]MCD4498519.1 EndoU domain-containing protein [Chromobacterium vaccinii]
MRSFLLFLFGLAATLPAAAAINCAPASIDVASVPVQVAVPPAANSRLNPQINLRHIFCGEINGGVATGFHAQPGGHNPQFGPEADAPLAARITGGVGYIVLPGAVHPGPYRYVGRGIQVRNAVTGAWVAKGGAGSSTFYPDACNREQVMASVRYAYTHAIVAAPPAGGQFVGPSAPAVNAADYCTGEDGAVFSIAGYLNLMGGVWRVNTAYPLSMF